jgi:hypothetical protein
MAGINADLLRCGTGGTQRAKAIFNCPDGVGEIL